MIRLGDENGVLQPLIELLQTHPLNANYLQADETRMPVLKEPGKSVHSDKWIWLIRGGQPVVLFHYDASLAGEWDWQKAVRERPDRCQLEICRYQSSGYLNFIRLKR